MLPPHLSSPDEDPCYLHLNFLTGHPTSRYISLLPLKKASPKILWAVFPDGLQITHASAVSSTSSTTDILEPTEVKIGTLNTLMRPKCF